MRVTFIIYSMQAGGAERVLSIMANYLAEKSYDVEIITLDSKPSSFYPLNSKIHHTALDLAAASKSRISGIFSNLRRLFRLRKAMKKSAPDAIISFMAETNVLSLLATRGLNLPVIITEHTDPWTAPVGKAWSVLRKRLYPYASRLVVLNSRAADFFSFCSHQNVVVFPNPVQVNIKGVHQNKITSWVDGETVAAMGRLSREKRFDLLIRAFSRLSESYPNWKLLILGEGPEREELECLIKASGLAGKVNLPGNIEHPHDLLRCAGLFVSSSDIEGFPMALCEAMACGLPVISTEYSSAVNEIIQDGENGILVPAGDVKKMSAAMQHLIENQSERERLSDKAKDTGVKLNVTNTMMKWVDLLETVTNSRPPQEL